MFSVFHTQLISRLLVICLLSTSAMSLAAATTNSGNKVLLCTSQGYQWVEMADESTFAQPNKHCIYCLLSDELDQARLEPNQNWYLRFATQQLHVSAVVINLPLRFGSSILPRAPPHLS